MESEDFKFEESLSSFHLFSSVSKSSVTHL